MVDGLIARATNSATVAAVSDPTPARVKQADVVRRVPEHGRHKAGHGEGGEELPQLNPALWVDLEP